MLSRINNFEQQPGKYIRQLVRLKTVPGAAFSLATPATPALAPNMPMIPMNPRRYGMN